MHRKAKMHRIPKGIDILMKEAAFNEVCKCKIHRVDMENNFRGKVLGRLGEPVKSSYRRLLFELNLERCRS